MTVGEQLKKIRIKAGFTIKDVVDMSDGNIEISGISRIENNERKPSLIAAYCMSEIYDVDLKEIAKMHCGKVKIKKLKK